MTPRPLPGKTTPLQGVPFSSAVGTPFQAERARAGLT